MPNRMNAAIAASTKKSSFLDPKTFLGLALAIGFFVGSGLVAHRNTNILRDDARQIFHSHEVIVAIGELRSSVQDAETGQRGYLLTGNDRYLEPYETAVANVERQIDKLATLTSDNASQQDRITGLQRRVTAKLAELKSTIDVRRAQGPAAALAIVNSDRGKAEMDAIRNALTVMQQEEARLRRERLVEMDAAYQSALVSGLMSGVLGIALTLVVGVLIRRAAVANERRQWLASGQVGLASAMLGDQESAELGDNILTFLARFAGAQAGAVFASEGEQYRRVASYGVPADAQIVERFGLREGLLGQVAADRQTTVLADVPEGYLTIGSALGRDKPRHLILFPAVAEDGVHGVVELGFLNAVDDRVREFLTEASEAVGIALRSARYRAELRELLEKTQSQAEELQVQSEELRVSNEELEEQGRALKESQVRLEQQQAELEQTNSQLEEQAQLLESQRDDLERSGAAVELKARELEQASRYKSDFLANMSHELRTPLNSLLILSKLLGDNPAGNLSEEQVQHARTIQSSGNDLLTLINDILDLSKIEAGHLEIRPETMSLPRLATDLRQLFAPLAAERKLDFAITVADDVPASMVSDRLRLEQVLKNLLSNAFKFTEKGGVTLEIVREGDDRLALSVTDTGIGIAEEQQQSIFEAFRQADGTISRKYGGTGLGLSISRELARLLGATISLA
uniref:CHASE3 domain-containing protein n=1 Tax=uncultured Caulobacter sp. TaxID=158749 RepID=UPI0025D0304F